MGLMYNPGNERLLTLPELHALPLPERLGRFHNPYPFGDYVENVMDALIDNDVYIRDAEFAVSHDNQRLFGLMKIGPNHGGWDMTLGVRGSHDQSIARALAVGTSVLVCSNLCFHGDLGTLHTRQTTHIGDRLPGMIKDAVSRIPEAEDRQRQMFDRYRNTVIRKDEGDAMLVELYRRGAFSSPQLTRAIDQWWTPDYEEHAEQPQSVWQLFNACTEALKPTGQNVNMELVRQRSVTVSEFMDRKVHGEYVGRELH